MNKLENTCLLAERTFTSGRKSESLNKKKSHILDEDWQIVLMDLYISMKMTYFHMKYVTLHMKMTYSDKMTYNVYNDNK